MIHAMQAGQVGRMVAGDDRWWLTASLLHMDGANASTSFTDQLGNTVTANGNAQISTAQSKFGGSSALFDGTGDYLSLSNSRLAPGYTNFTMEAWVYLNSNASGGFGSLGTSADSYGVSFWLTGAGAFRVRLGRSLAGNFDDVLGSGTLSTGQWYHIAVTRGASNVVTIWVDGVANATGSSALNLVQTNMVIGRAYPTYDGDYLSGYIDDFRFTEAVARYTTAFTPPAFPFPNSH